MMMEESAIPVVPVPYLEKLGEFGKTQGNDTTGRPTIVCALFLFLFFSFLSWYR